MLSFLPESICINKRYAVRLFEKSVDESYQGRTTKVVIDELLLIKKTDSLVPESFVGFANKKMIIKQW